MGSALTGQVADRAKVNRIELTDFARGDMDISVSNTDVTLISRDPAVRDRINLTRSLPGDRIDIVFTKDGKTQTLSITGTSQTLSPLTPVLPPVTS
jgi:S1-C subfamily serine protease